MVLWLRPHCFNSNRNTIIIITIIIIIIKHEHAQSEARQQDVTEALYTKLKWKMWADI